MSKRKIIMPTSEEDAVINSDIASSPEVVEAGEEFFARARPADRRMKALTVRYRGEQKAPKKVATSIRLSPEVLEVYKAGGKGWQGRIDLDLLTLIRKQKKQREKKTG